MNQDSTLYVGLDVHKDSITVAYATGLDDVELFGKIGTTQTAVDRLCKRLQSKARHVHVVYEAGPCGYGLHRRLIEKGFDSMVCAPSLIPRKQDNCQVAASLSVAPDEEGRPVAYQLYLPREWTDDPRRRQQAAWPMRSGLRSSRRSRSRSCAKHVFRLRTVRGGVLRRPGLTCRDDLTRPAEIAH